MTLVLHLFLRRCIQGEKARGSACGVLWFLRVSRLAGVSHNAVVASTYNGCVESWRGSDF